MKIIYSGFLLLFTAMTLTSWSKTKQAPWNKMQGNHSLSFVENKGQITDQYGKPRSDIDFSIASNGVSVFVGAGQIHYQWFKLKIDSATLLKDRFSEEALNLASQVLEAYRMDVSLLGANKQARLVKEEPLDYYERYYLPQFGIEGAVAHSYQKMVYKNVYPQIDWVIYIKGATVEYDFVVHPGGKVSDIRLHYAGADKLAIGEDGSFTATTPLGTVTESAPHSFQADGKVIASQYLLAQQTLGFKTEPHNGQLTIDPILKWATYYGGTAFLDQIYDIYIDQQDRVYICGSAPSANNIATIGAYQTMLRGDQDGYYAQFDSEGTRLYATYYGGEGTDNATGITMDTLGNIYITGQARSKTSIATVNSHQENHSTSNTADAYLVKFDSTGDRKWGTYYGGKGIEGYPRVSYSKGYMYLTGSTDSDENISTVGAYKEKNEAGDVFLVKFSLDGVRQWGTYFGGNVYDGLGSSIAADKNGDIYVSGFTSSKTGLATSNSHQSTFGGGKSDLFLAKFNDKGLLIWSTYYGGEKDETTYSLCNVFCDTLANVYLSGNTLSTTGIATNGAQQPLISDNADGLLVKFDSAGKRQWGTYIGGRGVEDNFAVKVLKDGQIYVTGNSTSDSGMVTPNALQPIYSGAGFVNRGDVIIAQYNLDGKKVYGSYFGGPSDEWISLVDMDSRGDLYLCGTTYSGIDIATPGSHLENFPGGMCNGYLAKFCYTYIPSGGIKGPDSVCAGAMATYMVDSVLDGDAYIWSWSDSLEGSSVGNSITVTNNGTGGSIHLQVVRCGDTSAIHTKELAIFKFDAPIINVDGFILSTIGQYSSYTWLLNGVPIPGADKSSYEVLENGHYSVTITDEKGCNVTSNTYEVSNVNNVPELERLSRSIRIFPNPASHLLTIEAPMPLTMELMSLDGRVLMRTQKMKNIDIVTLAPAVYMLRMYSSDGQLLKTEKLMKMSRD